MKRFTFFVSLALLLNFYSSAQVTKVLISGIGNSSVDANVSDAFNAGYRSYDGSSFDGVITFMTDGSTGAANSFSYADSNGYEVIIRSATGLSSAITIASSHPNVLAFMPAGSNIYRKEYAGNVSTCPVVVTGAGDAHNATAYFVEFFGPNPLPDPNAGNLSAYSNAYVAGQMCFIANYGQKSISEVRNLCRTNGKPTPLDADGFHDGYGLINTSLILSTAMPVELTSFTATTKGGEVTLNWKTATEVNNFGFDIERQIDSKKWEKIGFVRGQGNSNSPKDYFFVDKNLFSNKANYRLRQVDLDGKFQYFDQIEVNLKIQNFHLRQNYPNPFNPITKISFELPKGCQANLKVYDITGREVLTLLNGEKQAGVHEVEFDGSRLPSGTYVYRLVAGDVVDLKKMVLIK